MFAAFVHYLEPLVQNYGAIGIFLSSIIEEVIAPIPSSLVVFTGSLLVTKGLTGSAAVIAILLKVMIPASAGLAIGALFPYFLARIGEKVAIDRFGKYLGIRWSAVEKAQRWAQQSRSDEWIIFVSRAIPGMPSLAVSLVCGLLRIPVREFLLWSFLGALPRNLLLGLAGWWGGRQYVVVMKFLSGFESHVFILIAAVLVSLGAVWVYLQRRRGNGATGETPVAESAATHS